MNSSSIRQDYGIFTPTRYNQLIGFNRFFFGTFFLIDVYKRQPQVFPAVGIDLLPHKAATVVVHRQPAMAVEYLSLIHISVGNLYPDPDMRLRRYLSGGRLEQDA